MLKPNVGGGVVALVVEMGAEAKRWRGVVALVVEMGAEAKRWRRGGLLP